jgi:hypothetical protein
MKKLLLIILFPICIYAQYFPQIGSGNNDAIYKDSTIIKSWAKTCVVNRGWVNKDDKTLGKATFGVDSNAVGKAGGGSIVSLGDSGVAILSFNPPIANGSEADFVVFENGFVSTGSEPSAFLEFAFVEVSSNGTDFYRFNAISNIQTSSQNTSFGLSNASLVYNLAGKYLGNYGTPFDLEELKTISGLDVNKITHVKIVDVIGSVNAQKGSKDARGNMVNDPFPTPFSSSGFDLDAVGVINEATATEIRLVEEKLFSIYPNPLQGKSILNIISNEPIISMQIVDSKGFIKNIEFENTFPNYKTNLQEILNGIYMLNIKTDFQNFHTKLVVIE